MAGVKNVPFSNKPIKLEKPKPLSKQVGEKPKPLSKKAEGNPKPHINNNVKVEPKQVQAQNPDALERSQFLAGLHQKETSGASPMSGKPKAPVSLNKNVPSPMPPKPTAVMEKPKPLSKKGINDKPRPLSKKTSDTSSGESNQSFKAPNIPSAAKPVNQLGNVNKPSNSSIVKPIPKSINSKNSSSSLPKSADVRLPSAPVAKGSLIEENLLDEDDEDEDELELTEEEVQNMWDANAVNGTKRILQDYNSASGKKFKFDSETQSTQRSNNMVNGHSNQLKSHANGNKDKILSKQNGSSSSKVVTKSGVVTPMGRTSSSEESFSPTTTKIADKTRNDAGGIDNSKKDFMLKPSKLSHAPSSVQPNKVTGQKTGPSIIGSQVNKPDSLEMSQNKNGASNESSDKSLDSKACEVCNQKFEGPRKNMQYISHVTQHFKEEMLGDLKEKLPPYKCPISACNYQNRNKTDWLRHYATVHGQVNKYIKMYKEEVEARKKVQQSPEKPPDEPYMNGQKTTDDEDDEDIILDDNELDDEDSSFENSSKLENIIKNSSFGKPKTNGISEQAQGKPANKTTNDVSSFRSPKTSTFSHAPSTKSSTFSHTPSSKAQTFSYKTSSSIVRNELSSSSSPEPSDAEPSSSDDPAVFKLILPGSENGSEGQFFIELKDYVKLKEERDSARVQLKEEKDSTKKTTKGVSDNGKNNDGTNDMFSREEAKALRESNKHLQAVISRLEKEKQNLKEEAKRSQHVIDKSDSAKMNGMSKSNQEIFLALEGKNKGLQQVISNLEEEKTLILDEIESLNKQLKEQQQKTQMEEDRVRLLESNNQKLINISKKSSSDQVKELSKEVEILSNLRIQHSRHIEDIERQNTKLQEGNFSLKRSAEKIKIDYESKLKEKDVEIDEIKKESSQEKGNSKRMGRMIQDLETRNKELKLGNGGSSSGLNHELEQSQKKVASLTEQLNDLRNRNAVQSQKMAELESEQKVAFDEAGISTELKDKFTKLESVVRSKTAEISSLKLCIDRITRENEKWSKEIDEINNKNRCKYPEHTKMQGCYKKIRETFLIDQKLDAESKKYLTDDAVADFIVDAVKEHYDMKRHYESEIMRSVNKIRRLQKNVSDKTQESNNYEKLALEKDRAISQLNKRLLTIQLKSGRSFEDKPLRDKDVHKKDTVTISLDRDEHRSKKNTRSSRSLRDIKISRSRKRSEDEEEEVPDYIQYNPSIHGEIIIE